MKRTNTNQEYILLRAYTNSEWDACDFIIVKVDAAWLEIVKNRVSATILLKADSSFSEIVFWDAPEGFYTSTDAEAEIIDELQKNGEDWCFIDITAEELEILSVPENALDCFTMAVSRYGNIQYKAYGKHSGEEFYCASIQFDLLLQQLTTK